MDIKFCNNITELYLASKKEFSRYSYAIVYLLFRTVYYKNEKLFNMKNDRMYIWHAICELIATSRFKRAQDRLLDTIYVTR